MLVTLLYAVRGGVRVGLGTALDEAVAVAVVVDR